MEKSTLWALIFAAVIIVIIIFVIFYIMLSTPNTANNTAVITGGSGIGNLTTISPSSQSEFKEAFIGITSEKGYKFINFHNQITLEDKPSHNYSYNNQGEFLAHNLTTGEKFSTQELVLTKISTNQYHIAGKGGNLLRQNGENIVFSPNINYKPVAITLLKKVVTNL